MKNARVILTAAVITCIFGITFYFLWLPPRYVVPILGYHRLGYDSGRLFVTPENFDKQMAYLKNKGYEVISLDELIDGIKSAKRLPHKTVVITFDDGYEDNYHYAYPILKKYKFPATIFLIANRIGKTDYINRDEIKVMSNDNILFGAHTKEERYLPYIKEKEILWDEIAGSKKVIEEITGKPVNCFSYPSGVFTEEIKKVVKEARFKGACTTNKGFSKLNKDVYELKRVKITNSEMVKPFSYWAKLSGYYNLFRKGKRPY
ncbi:MAG: polysaccharide deacetylase [Candidatus Omnitrophica bacterium CG07_land_8_20_14_0_80_42_15]|uniref:Polysaccharide deacetylase n=1 Tax=Candidatus Aquitaenariimonas noxiae TaxID=1974741 RepID=A0A2J0KQN1_9BACT|nr:MAG: polysaccharide deacetylase [Candidatus Omnitrophica bacterium CG07_land_8_20_14_0_80_42_15]